MPEALTETQQKFVRTIWDCDAFKIAEFANFVSHRDDPDRPPSPNKFTMEAQDCIPGTYVNLRQGMRDVMYEALERAGKIGQIDAIAGVPHGGLIPAQDLARKLIREQQKASKVISSHKEGNLFILDKPEEGETDEDVLLEDDVLTSGTSLLRLSRLFRRATTAVVAVDREEYGPRNLRKAGIEPVIGITVTQFLDHSLALGIINQGIRDKHTAYPRMMRDHLDYRASLTAGNN